jgi:hypothetical protein
MHTHIFSRKRKSDSNLRLEKKAEVELVGLSFSLINKT